MYNKIDDINTMKMIGLVGKARSGKSSVANVLVKECGYLQYAMAGAIRKAILTALPFVEARFLHEDKEETVPELGVTGRHLLQTMGHNWGRNNNPDTWILALEKELEIMKVDHRKVVIDDVRYDNEIDWIKSKGGYIIGVERPYLEGVEQQSWREHPSEAGVDVNKIDEWISNISPYTTDLECATRNVMNRLFDPELAQASCYLR